MRDDLMLTLIRELKGSPLLVWATLYLAGERAVTQKWLQENCGYSDKTVRRALKKLNDRGLARQVKGGWVIVEGPEKQALARVMARL